MEEITQVLMQGVITLAGTVITVITGILGYKLTQWGNQWINKQNTAFTSEEKKRIAETTVKYVEQVFKDAHGEEKLAAAKAKALALLQAENIDITDEQLEILIEAAVKGLNEGVTRV